MQPTRPVAWRHGILAVLFIGTLAATMGLDPIRQNPAYHDFADRRPFLGVPNAMDVVSNLPFVLVGLLGLRHCARATAESDRAAWCVLFAGVGLVGIGSGWYHRAPDNATLVWDRLPMTVGFMGLFTALLGEYISPRLGRLVLVPAVLAGIFSVLYWHWTDDLRPYFWVQFFPLLAIPALMLLFPARHTHGWLLLAALGLYLLAKAAEQLDAPIFDFTGRTLGGHAVKHLLAALGCGAIWLMLCSRTPRKTAAGGPEAPEK